MRDPDLVMDLKRMGAMHQTRLSFTRSLIRRMAKDAWKVSMLQTDMDSNGFGTTIYEIETPGNVYQVVIFSDYIPDEERNDRVIADKWDCTFALVRGKVTEKSLENLRRNVPLQEAGRCSEEVLVLSRANKSVRIFDHVVESLAAGRQPDGPGLAEVGYILRTTAVYGNGKFGLLDYSSLIHHSDFDLSYSAQMCAVYILRQFSVDWVNYLAKMRGGDKAVELDRKYQRYLGTGNATGLGMSLYLIRHPQIVNAWMDEREQAFSASLAQPVTDERCRYLVHLLNRAAEHLHQVVTIDEHQKKLNICASREIGRVAAYLADNHGAMKNWESLFEFAQQFSYEAQEIVISCIMELYPHLVDRHEYNLIVDERLRCIQGIRVDELLSVIDTAYKWVFSIDYGNPDSQYWFWYVSENKNEPRLGSRYEEPGADQELPLDIARQVQTLRRDLLTQEKSASVNEFLLKYPRHHDLVRRVVTMGGTVMGEIRSNVLGRDMLPMDFLRAKLAMFGATKFDPRSDRWVRVTFFQNAPLIDELHENEWLFPVLPAIQRS